MRIIFAGTPDLAAVSLRYLSLGPHEIVGVLTRADAPYGRKRILTPSPVAALADELNIPTFKTNRLDEEATTWLASLGADLGVVVAYGALLKKEQLDVPGLGWINLHFSKLPNWRGAAPVQRALMNGERKIGVSVFRLTEALDAGAIVSEAEYEFPRETTSGIVLESLAHDTKALLLKAIAALEENPNAGIAQEGVISYAHKLERADAKLDFSESAAEFFDRYAGTTPEPGAWALLDSQSFKIKGLKEPAEPLGLQLSPGEVVLHENKIYLGVREGELILTRVQPSGKQEMDAKDWFMGTRDRVFLG